MADKSKSKKTKFISIDEFLVTQTLCKFGFRCTNENCKFAHNLKTKMCKFGDNCRRGNRCSFAHSETEIYVPDCKFSMRCKNPNCKFKHPDPNFWKVTSKQNINLSENLTKKNFPNSMKIKVNVVKDEEVINYKEMRNIIKKVDSITISHKNIDDMIEDYECIHEFEEIIFNFN